VRTTKAFLELWFFSNTVFQCRVVDTKFTRPVHIYKIFVSTQYYYNYTVSVTFHRQEGENVVQYKEVLPMKRLHQDYYDFDYDNIIQVDISPSTNSAVMIEYDFFGTY